MTKGKTEHLTVSALKARGWTDKLIKTLLGDPDKTATNPRYRSAAPMRLYALPRIEAAEITPEFANKPSQEKRREASLNAAERKRQRLVDYIMSLPIAIPDFQEEDLILQACMAYNGRNAHNDKWACPTDSVDFLHRITVNYLRHECSQYDDIICRMFGATGKDLAYSILRDKVLDAIADKYEFLECECLRQQGQ